MRTGRDPARHRAGPVTLGGRRVLVSRPRARAADGSGEVPVPTYQLFSSTELLGRMAIARMLASVSTRRYPAALEPVGDQVSQDATSTSRSAVSRKFVAMTEHALADLLPADLAGLDLVAIMIDGVHDVARRPPISSASAATRRAQPSTPGARSAGYVP